MKFNDRILKSKVKSLIKAINKRGIVTNWEEMQCDALHIYSNKNSLRIHDRETDTNVEIKR